MMNPPRSDATPRPEFLDLTKPELRWHVCRKIVNAAANPTPADMVNGLHHRASDSPTLADMEFLARAAAVERILMEYE